MRVRNAIFLVIFLLMTLFSAVVLGQDEAEVEASSQMESADSKAMTLPAPVTNLKAVNTPNDHGHSFTVTWDLSADDGVGAANVMSYRVMRSEKKEGPFVLRKAVTPGKTLFQDNGSKSKDSPDFSADFTDFYYRVDAVTIDSTVFAISSVFGPVQSKGEWYNTGRTRERFHNYGRDIGCVV